MRLEPIPPGHAPPLDDASARAHDDRPKHDLEAALAELGPALERLQTALFAEGRRALLVILQGRDGSGKDGVVRHVGRLFNPQGLRVTGFRAPTATERAHDFLWRVHAATPARGTVGIFNRSQYEEVLVPRVHGEIARDEWERRYREINDFERMLAEQGTTIVKFFLHVSRAEQRERLLARLDQPDKRWKFDPADLGERDRWDAYTDAYRDLLARCSTAYAPWYVVPADRKPLRDLLVAETLHQTLETMRPAFPPADASFDRYRSELE
jgi:PPK2 family polyphosphate:nucleotide phosphotransferase